MNREQATSLIAYLNRAGLVGALEGQAAVWADALEDVDYADAQQVVRHFVATRTSDQRWVTPGDIAAGVRKVALQRLNRGTAAEGVPDADPDDVPAYLEALRDGRQRVLAGHDLRERPVRQLVAQTAQTTALPRKDHP